jgi:hypothetical protein
MTKPLIQIDDEIREMTDEEHDLYLQAISEASQNTQTIFDQ